MAQNKTTKVLIWLLAFIVILGGIVFGLIKLSIINLGGKSTQSEENQTTSLDNIKVYGLLFSKNFYPNSEVEGSILALNYNIYESLATFNRDNILIPLIASKWDNPNDLTWRFYISSKAKFSNGDPVTAEDVKFTYDYIKGQKDLPISTSLPDATVTVGANNTVEFVTQNPDPLLINKLAWCFLILQKNDIEKNGINNKNIGTGHYIVSEANDQTIKLVTNENYWGEKPKIKTVTYLQSSETSSIPYLISGAADVIFYTSTDKDVDLLNGAVSGGKINLKKVSLPLVNYFDLDSSSDKTKYIDLPTNPFKDKRVREAITLAIDMDNFSKNNPDTTTVSQLVTQGIFGYNPEIVRPKYNLDKAKELMSQAGYPNGFTVTVDFVESTTKEITAFSNDLAKINITTKLNPLSSENFFPKIMSKDTSMYYVGYSPDTKDASEVLEGLVHTPSQIYGQYNLSYSNPDIDKVIEEISKTMNQKTRQQKVKQAMKLAMDDYAKIPLFYPYMNYAISSKIYWKPRLDG
ncbi:MAG: ABC transporter substrate-binding protein, partial [Patescibacteria group bacterium]|nr:ABC transporter substrate-binding protein [Patescibacteria group bacterium]